MRGVLSIYTALDSVTAQFNIFLLHAETFTGGYLNLSLYEVETGNFLSYRVLDLNTCIHLHEVEIAVLVNEELYSSRVIVSALFCRSDSCLTHFLSELAVNYRTRALLKYLLITALHRAVALAEVDVIAMSIGDYLNLDMVRIYEEFFYINSIVAEEVFCLLLSGSHLSFEVLRGIYSPDTSSAAACRSLNEYGISAFFGNFLSLCE